MPCPYRTILILLVGITVIGVHSDCGVGFHRLGGEWRLTVAVILVRWLNASGGTLGMKFSIEQRDTDILIRIEDFGEPGEHFLDAVRSCGKATQQGCALECGKMASIEETSHANTVVMRMVPRPGERVDANTVKRCLEALSKSCSRDRACD